MLLFFNILKLGQSLLIALPAVSSLRSRPDCSEKLKRPWRSGEEFSTDRYHVFESGATWMIYVYIYMYMYMYLHSYSQWKNQSQSHAGSNRLLKTGNFVQVGSNCVNLWAFWCFKALVCKPSLLQYPMLWPVQASTYETIISRFPCCTHFTSLCSSFPQHFSIL